MLVNTVRNVFPLLLAGLALTPYDPDLIGSLSLLELIWILMSSFGFPFGVRNLVRSLATVAVAKTPPVDDVEVDMSTLFRVIQACIVTIQAGMLGLGFYAAITPPAIRVELRTLNGLIIGIIFIIGAGIINWLSWYIDRRQRNMMKRYAKRVSAMREEALRLAAATELAHSNTEAALAATVEAQGATVVAQEAAAVAQEAVIAAQAETIALHVEATIVVAEANATALEAHEKLEEHEGDPTAHSHVTSEDGKVALTVWVDKKVAATAGGAGAGADQQQEPPHQHVHIQQKESNEHGSVTSTDGEVDR